MSDDVVQRIDTTKPHSARFWNYWLGGKDNYEVDREVGDQIKEIFPGLVDVARSRAATSWAARSATWPAEQGVRQFLDIGTGLPTADNTHEVAQRVAPDARIVYVDNDPLVLAHARALLTSTPEGATDYLDADLYDPEAILEAAARHAGPLQAGRADDPQRARPCRRLRPRPVPWSRRLMAGLPSGSHLVISDSTATSEGMIAASEAYNASGAVPYYVRAATRSPPSSTGWSWSSPASSRSRSGARRADTAVVDAYGGWAASRKPAQVARVTATAALRSAQKPGWALMR